MKIQATDLVQGALYIHYGLTLSAARMVWVRGQLVLGMEFEGEKAAEALADWEGQEVPMVMAHDYRSLILALAKLAGGQSMTVITIGQRKGGNGKSTSALNLAHAFALTGKRVLLVDMDDQKNSTSAIETTIIPVKTIEDLLLDPAVTVAEVAVPTAWEDVWLIAASGSLSGTIRELDGEVGSHLVLKEKLSCAAEAFDLCLIDTSPSLNILVVNALCTSRWLFVPLSSKYFSLQGLGQTLEAFQKVKGRLNPDLSILALAFVIHDRRSGLARDVVDKARTAYPSLVCDTLVGQNIKIEEAQVLRQSILGYAPEDRGAEQYRALAAELLARLGR